MFIHFFQSVLVIRTTNYSDLETVWEWGRMTPVQYHSCRSITPTQEICIVIEKQYLQVFICYINSCTLWTIDQSTECNKLETTSLLTSSFVITMNSSCSSSIIFLPHWLFYVHFHYYNRYAAIYAFQNILHMTWLII